jgi:hypothetical protein
MHDAAPIESDSDSPGELDFECPPPNKTPLLQKTHFFACLRCRKPRPLEKIYRLCAFCMQECQRDPKQEKFWLRGQREQPERPTSASPGSTEKIGVLRRRVLRGEELFGEEDAVVPVDWAKVNVAAMLADPIMREAGQTGVERDGDNWRARPMYEGEKHNLGMFRDEREAVAKVQSFWQEVFGLDSNATSDDVEEARKRDEKRRQVKVQAERDKADYERRMAIPTPLFDSLDSVEQAV